ncbi:MAG: hypothetical protein AAFY56_23590 [Pseudomonadota bacterium]
MAYEVFLATGCKSDLDSIFEHLRNNYEETGQHPAAAAARRRSHA